MKIYNEQSIYNQFHSVGDIVRSANSRILSMEHKVINNNKYKYRNVDIDTIREVDSTDPNFFDLHCLISRQRLYGYIDYRDGYVIGKCNDGSLFKVNMGLYKSQHPFDELEEPLEKIIETAVYGSHFQNVKMYKLTYDEQYTKNFSIHTDWVEYKPGSYVYDANMYCGLHFTSLSSVMNTFNDIHTIYGHKLVILSFPEELQSEIYYNYQSDYWCGDRLYVETTMDLSDLMTWDYIMSTLDFKETEGVRKFLDSSIKYLQRLTDEVGFNYNEIMAYLEEKMSIIKIK